MSPEQASGGEIDERTDIFSLGVTLYQMATGRRPFREENLRATLRAIRETDPASPHKLNPALPQAMERIILKALAKDPGLRYQQVSEMAADLEKLRRSAEPSRRVARLWMVAAILSAFCALACFVWILNHTTGTRVSPKGLVVPPLENLGQRKAQGPAGDRGAEERWGGYRRQRAQGVRQADNHCRPHASPGRPPDLAALV